jgi:hypothetical protein
MGFKLKIYKWLKTRILNKFMGLLVKTIIETEKVWFIMLMMLWISLTNQVFQGNRKKWHLKENFNFKIIMIRILKSIKMMLVSFNKWKIQARTKNEKLTNTFFKSLKV